MSHQSKNITFKPHCIGVKSPNGIRRVNISQRRTANDQISDALVNVPFSKANTKQMLSIRLFLEIILTFRCHPSRLIKFNVRLKWKMTIRQIQSSNIFLVNLNKHNEKLTLDFFHSFIIRKGDTDIPEDRDTSVVVFLD